MSARRPPPSTPLFGSLQGPAIDFLLPEDGKSQQQPDIALRLVNNGIGSFFLVEMYFGAIADDSIVVTTPAFSGQKYLRFKLSLISSKSGRREFSKRIADKMKPLMAGKGLGEAMYTDSYVCGSPANSFFVVSFACNKDSTFNLDAAAAAKAITGVDPKTNFVIDSDGHMYQYTLNGGAMRVARS